MYCSGKSVVFLCVVLSGCYCASVAVKDKEIECYAQEKVYHEESDQCYKLAVKGPCEAGKWLVLEKNPKRINPICVQEKCKDGEYYMPNTQTCVESKNKAMVCGEWQGVELINNVFGEGECVCTREPWRTRIGGDKNCYQLYTRGPCAAGQVVALPKNDTTEAACVNDPCLNFKKPGYDVVLAPSENGTCYELGTRGPCPEGLTFKVHVSSLKPSCVSLTTTIFSLQRPQNCYQDENGDCQKRVTNNRRREAEKFQKELFNAIRN
ncbi:UNVERIFIED_CONTAM: hypothetical protein PYX00_002196 [Menopon gallinae]|uniref:DUF4789 domain-containing protein n=1 Tax=Menopon gallinae TaxID=328185 RepID=A0AAW2IG12_9NEOP